MIEIKVDGDKVVFEVEGWDKLWSLRSRLEIPLAHIKDVHADPKPAMGWFDGLKLAGTALPNIFKAGIFYQEGDLVFWDVHNPEKTVVVELDHEHFAKLIIEVAEPDTAVRLLEDVISQRRA
ncbi:MAG: hypothetical protein M3033_10345 [Acidobacteriota bacterium]|nr:hypothetical protein [Acidobacteriota bacterium]